MIDQLFGVVRVLHDAPVALDEVPIDARRRRQQFVQLLRLSTTKHAQLIVDLVHDHSGHVTHISHETLIYVGIYLPHQIFGFPTFGTKG